MMNDTVTRRTQWAALGLAGTFFLAVAGCGGGKSDTDEARVVPAADANLTPSATGTGTPAPTAGGTAPAAAPTASAPAAPVKSEGWGVLKGQVVFGGTPPAHENLYDKGKAPKDADTVCSKDSPIPDERLVVDGESKGVKNVLVYIPKPTAVNDDAKKAAASAKIEFDQANCTFKPHILAMMAGDTIELKSSDPVNHNINAKPKVNTKFNSILAGGQKVSFETKYGERSPAEVVCDIHPWMRAYWLILDNPYFAVTDEKGNFEIKNAPAGTQKVVVWQEAVAKGGFVTAPSGEEINIKKDDTTTKTFTIDPGKILADK